MSSGGTRVDILLFSRQAFLATRIRLEWREERFAMSRARRVVSSLAERRDGEDGFDPDHPDHVDGPRIVYDREAQIMQPTAADLRVIDQALAFVSACVAPGAPRPDQLSARPDNDALPHFLMVTRVANDVGVSARRMAPVYAQLLEAYLAQKSGEGPDEQILDLGELGDEGYVVVLTRCFAAQSGFTVHVDVRPRRSGTAPGIGVNAMIAHGFRPAEIIRSQLAYLKTPGGILVSLRRASGED